MFIYRYLWLLQLAEQQQHEQYNQNHPAKPHAGVTQAVAVPADPAAPAAKQVKYHQNDEDRSKRHGAPPRSCRRQTDSADRIKKNGMTCRSVPSREPKLQHVGGEGLLFGLVD